MKYIAVVLCIGLFACSSAPERAPASTKLDLEKVERRGCCSHHQGVMACVGDDAVCNDGHVSKGCCRLW